MKKNLLLIVLILSAITANSQNCFLAKKAGGFDYDYCRGIVVNANNSVFLAGHYASNNFSIGDTVLHNQTTADNFYDMFLAKFDRYGNFKWAKDFTSGNGEGISAFSMDQNSYLYIVGDYAGSYIKFDNDSLINSRPQFSDNYIAKLDSNGNTVWAKNITWHDWMYIYAITADPSGNVIITGSFSGDSIIFDNLTLHKVSTATSDFFIAKYDQNGNILWAKNTGGRFPDYGIKITTDSYGNAYVLGRFNSDSLSFDNVHYIYNNATYNGDFFIVKYDPDGNALWVQNHSGGDIATGGGICSDGTNIYVSGRYRAQSMTLGGITVYNTSVYGSFYDIFVYKLNSDGNAIWGRSAGGNKDDLGQNITSDNNGNAYLTGHFYSDSIRFGNIQLNNAGPSYSYTMNYLFVVKFDNLGNPVWANRGQGTFNEEDFIAVNDENNVFISGNYWDDPITLGNTTLDISGYQDIYLANIYAFSSQINTFSNASCNGFNNGSAIASYTGGMNPVSFLWSNGSTSDSAINLTAGSYIVTVSDANQCSQVLSITITEPPADSARICMVTVDSTSMYNIVFWDKTNFTTVDSFVVYREIFTNNFQPIGSVPFSAPGYFIDTVRTLYFPNTGDPNSGTFRYKIMVHDTCGGYSVFSPYHNTIYLLNSAGNFYWTQPYSIENGPNPVASYVLMRDDNSDGNWHAVTSVAGTQQVISDPLYLIYKNTASWRVKTQWSINCAPTLKDISTYNYSLSNIYTEATVNINEGYLSRFVHIYPVPAEDFIEVYYQNLEIKSIQITGLIGNPVKNPVNISDEKIRINITDFHPGIYLVNVLTNRGNLVKKIIKY